jgi:Cu(I)/Ag(I) efflux system membrane fusion protein
MDVQPPASSPAARAPRRFGPVALLSVALLSAGVAAGSVLWVMQPKAAEQQHAAAPSGEATTVYQCPMHPSVVQDHPGDCPICGMKLVPVDKGKVGAPPQAKAARRVRFYRSPMDPQQTSPTPRKDAMGMDYLPVYEDEPLATAPVAGLATVEIDPDRQQLIGLTTEPVTQGPVGGAWRTLGRVTRDETRVRHINLKVPGFVERIYVDFVGKKVKKGDPLFSVYSPELLSAQEEYLLALKMQRAFAKTGAPSAYRVSGDAQALVEAARRKLSLWDVPDSEIERVARSGQPTKTLTFNSPVAGVVTRKDVVEGMKLDAGAMPYEIVDLSTVWVLADVYESELRFVAQGMAGSLRLNAFPNRDWQGKVVFIDPSLDAQTRTVKVRLTFPNPTGELRPEMFGEVVLHGQPHEGLRVPTDAVIDSGTQKVVFVAVGEGKFEPRSVKLGEGDSSHVEIVSGLALGERVVTRANFLIDSESRLRASLAAMSATAPEAARVLPGATAAEPLAHEPAASHEPLREAARSPVNSEHHGHPP